MGFLSYTTRIYMEIAIWSQVKSELSLCCAFQFISAG